MKNCAIVLCMLPLAGCGYASMQNEVIGQVKKVIHQTPLICPDRVDVDLSLGVMRNGVGSMSTQDAFFTVANEALVNTLNEAAKAGQLVNIKYNVKRVTWCSEDHLVTEVTIVK